MDFLFKRFPSCVSLIGHCWLRRAVPDGVYALDVHMERLANRASDAAISEYRWMVEEYRIQLFAQPMKTRMAVSPKRLSKMWDKVG